MATYQGKVVIERDGTRYLVMFPDGAVESFTNKAQIYNAAKKWFKDNLRTGAKMGVGEIEWRHGIKPYTPKG